MKTKILGETNKFKMVMYKTNKILQRMEEKREKEVKVNDGSSGSPVSGKKNLQTLRSTRDQRFQEN